MNEKDRNESEPSDEQRRKQFAPHASPRKQADGDPGSNSPREGSDDERGAESPETVQDQSTKD
jgi:hypothetical protein